MRLTHFMDNLIELVACCLISSLMAQGAQTLFAEMGLVVSAGPMWRGLLLVLCTQWTLRRRREMAESRARRAQQSGGVSV